MSDNVKNPSYYNRGKIEVWEFIEDQNLDYHTGNAVKYIARAGFKDPSKEVEDLQKAVAFLERKIRLLSLTTIESETGMGAEEFIQSLTWEQKEYLDGQYKFREEMLVHFIDKHNKHKTEKTKQDCLNWFYCLLDYINLLRAPRLFDKARELKQKMKDAEIF